MPVSSSEPRIRVLPPEAVDRIAAGEVVERPSSVVKELVENSLDAGARSVIIRLEDGGRRRIQVGDDGHGMSPAEIRLALERHATSKIRSIDDLARLRSLGFRGEALPSIAAVSRMEIVSREPSADFAWRVRVEGGRVVADQAAAGPPGTTVTVDDLFFNTPARRKHLRRPATELDRIVDLVHGLALASPGTRFRLEHGSRLLFSTSGSGDVLDAAAAVLGADTAAGLLVGADQRGEPGAPFRRLEVWAGLPSAARAGRQFQFFIVNGRAVRSDRLRAALERPYRRLLPLHRYPVAVVRLEVDPAAVDVNVHPSKQEIRLDREREVADALQALVHRLLARADLAPRVTLSPRAPALGAAGVREAAQVTPLVDGLPGRPQGQGPRQGPAAGGAEAAGPGLVREQAAPYHEAPGEAHGRPRFADLRILGQVDLTYLVAEGPEGLCIIDQHAAHERVVFEQLLGRGPGGPPPRQALAVPLTLELDAAAMERWRRHRHRLPQFGFVTEEFGPRAVMVREVPLLYRRPAGAPELLDLLDALGDAAEPDPEALEADLAQRTTAACRTAVKARDPLTADEARHLLRLLDGCRNPYTCPHGRPTLLVMRLGELERHFKRIM
ncbi:MAG: DNA mismatch repair endonuclease MutL [Thermaerobacter sp.]|nr:DNA mismatch repair protein MutL [Bacillota bacterium]